MNNLLMISTALVLIGCLNHSANAESAAPSSTPPTSSAPTATPVAKTPAAVHPILDITCDSVALGWAPVPGQPNLYQRAGQPCGGPPTPGFTGFLPAGAKHLISGWIPVAGQPNNNFQPAEYISGNSAPVGFVTEIPYDAKRWGWVPVAGQLNTFQPAVYGYSLSGFTYVLPAGAKILNSNNNPVTRTQPVALQPNPVMPVPIVTLSPKPIAAPVATPAPNPASVQWMPYIYYRYPSAGGMIYVNDNNGVSYLQHPDGTKTDLPPVPNGQFLRRSPQYQLPIWLRDKWTQNPADNGEYFVAAGNGNSSNRIITKGQDGALQVRYTTLNQYTGRDGVVHQVTPASSVTVKP